MAWRDTDSAHRFYHSKSWDNARKLVLDRSSGLCESCLAKGKLTPAESVHHKIPLDTEKVNDPAISLNPDNLIALCHDCHTAAHKRLGIGALGTARAYEPRVGFDNEGNVVKL